MDETQGYVTAQEDVMQQENLIEQEDLVKQETDFIMLPKIDFCFKELMIDSEIRNGFLATVLEIAPKEIEKTELLPTILQKHYQDDKWGILDVRVKMKDGSQVDIEIQLIDYDDWSERSLFYLCKMFVEQIKEGEEYTSLKKCIHIGILNFDLFDGADYYSRFHLREDFRDELYSDKLEIHILELKKAGNPELPESELLHWTRFLSGDKKEDLEKMAEKNPYIQKAYDHILDISVDELKRREYEFHMKAKRDKISIMAFKKKYEQKAAEADKQLAEADKQLAEAGRKFLEAKKLQVEMQIKFITAVYKKLRKGKDVETIADELEETVDSIRPIYETIIKFGPDYDLNAIYAELIPEE